MIYMRSILDQQQNKKYLLGGLRKVIPSTSDQVNNIQANKCIDLFDKIYAKELASSLSYESLWTGFLTLTDDKRPYLGPIESDIYIATGFNGNGMCKVFMLDFISLNL